MVTSHPKSAAHVQEPLFVESMEVVNWVFLHGEMAISCEIRRVGPNAFDVCILPHWDIAASAVERYSSMRDALARHARLALAFRQAGWRVMREGRA